MLYGFAFLGAVDGALLNEANAAIAKFPQERDAGDFAKVLQDQEGNPDELY